VCHLTGGIESTFAATKNKEHTTDNLGELDQKTPAEAIPEPQSNTEAITTGKIEENTNIGRDDILSKLTIDYGVDMNELSKVLSVVLSNVYNQLEAALKEKVEAEIAKSIAEEKLQHLIDNKNN
jgi:predicted DsbA family dithiol-disulfide isomerase